MFYQLLRVKPTASAQEIDNAYLEYTRAKDLEGDGGRVNEHDDSKEMIRKAYAVLGDPNKREQYDLQVAHHIASLEEEAEQHRQFLEGAEIVEHLEAGEEGFSTMCQEVKDFRIASERQHLERALAMILGSIEEARREENTARPKTIETTETEDFGSLAEKQLEREMRAEDHRAARERRRAERSAGDSGEEVEGVVEHAGHGGAAGSSSGSGSGSSCNHGSKRRYWGIARMTRKNCQMCGVAVGKGIGYRCCRCHMAVCRECFESVKQGAKQTL
ncbi:hypothetical protein QBC37DRAFT_371979 [Rhypophila decipiens]|uniref:J domain-containing protein n=1 Tax=Rhypophila decipiens TaxID=261697 RepID=A0AAN6YA65_9PEZI|nr:hypothetical protein QBC37DRAFT_371979 [Rhypophila decipiens]